MITMRFIPCFVLLLVRLSCPAQGVPTPVAVVPTPASVMMGKGHFVFGPETIIQAGTGETRLVHVFTEYLRRTWKFNNPVFTGVSETMRREQPTGRRRQPVVYLGSRGADSLPAEGYRLSITPDSIVLTGKGAGLFYGIQSLIQLFPNEPGATANLTCLTI